jgi:hypothetical protein
MKIKIKKKKQICLLFGMGAKLKSLTLTEERTLNVSENNLLRRIFGYKRDEVAGGWRRLHNEELLNSYASSNPILGDQIKEDEMGGSCNPDREMRNAYNILDGKPEGKRPLGRPKRKWEDNIRKEMDWEGVNWVHLVQDRDQWRAHLNTVMNARGFRKGGEFLAS